MAAPLADYTHYEVCASYNELHSMTTVGITQVSLLV